MRVVLPQTNLPNSTAEGVLLFPPGMGYLIKNDKIRKYVKIREVKRLKRLKNT